MTGTKKAILTDKDIKILFGDKYEKAKESIETILKETPNMDAWEILDHLSHGRGTEAWNHYTNELLFSKEYNGVFKYCMNAKTFDISTPNGFANHIFRNNNQRGKAPRNLDDMMKFVMAGYYIFEGFSPCHNLDSKTNTPEGRRNTLIFTIKSVSKGTFKKRNEYAPINNMSFRGAPGSAFEGCQFIYNADSKKLVCDNINRGTWDFGKYGTLAHFLYDVFPWVDVGNGDNIETPEMFYMTPTETTLYLSRARKLSNDELRRIHDKEVQKDKANNVVIKQYIKFVDKYLREKKMKEAHEDYQGTIITKSVEEYEEEKAVAINEFKQKNLEKFIDGEIHRLTYQFQGDWGNFISLASAIDDRTIIDGPVASKIISHYDTYPGNLKFKTTDEDKAIFFRNCLRNTIVCLKPEERKEGNIVKNDLYIRIKFYMNPELESSYSDKNDDMTIGMFRAYRDKAVDEINNELKKYSCSCRVVGDVTDSSDISSFTVALSMDRVISLLEEKIACSEYLSKKILEISSTDEDSNVKPVPSGYVVDSKENFNNPLQYSTEGFIELIATYFASLIGAVFVYIIIIILILAAVKLVQLDEEAKKKIIEAMKPHFKKIDAALDQEYEEYKKGFLAVSSQNTLKAMKRYDPYGEYWLPVRGENFYHNSFYIESKDTFKERIMHRFSEELRDHYGDENKARKFLENYKIKYEALSGRPLKNLDDKLEPDHKVPGYDEMKKRRDKHFKPSSDLVIDSDNVLILSENLSSFKNFIKDHKKKMTDYYKDFDNKTTGGEVMIEYEDMTNYSPMTMHVNYQKPLNKLNIELFLEAAKEAKQTILELKKKKK